MRRGIMASLCDSTSSIGTRATWWRVIAAHMALTLVVTGGLFTAESLPAKALKPEPLDGQPPVQLVVSAAAEPVPALKYRLLPTLAEQIPGNAAIDYERVLSRPFVRVDDKRVTGWMDLPLDRLPLKDVEAAVEQYGPLFAGLELASHRQGRD